MHCNFIDITDVIKQILRTKQISGIPRIVVTIIENRESFTNLFFGIYKSGKRKFFKINNLSSIDFSQLQSYESKNSCDVLEEWEMLFDPDLSPMGLDDLPVNYCLLSAQWETFAKDEDFFFLKALLKNEMVSCLHHDSYLLDQPAIDPKIKLTQEKFEQYWRVVKESGARLQFISEHTYHNFINKFGDTPSNIAHYDFSMAYPNLITGSSEKLSAIIRSRTNYALIFTVIDGRKSAIELIESLRNQGKKIDVRIVLVLRFVLDDDPEKIRLINEIIDQKIDVFISPDDLTYLKLIRYARWVFYPSYKEGYGLVPLDCKRFGKFCFVPEGADFTYLHTNIIDYKNEDLTKAFLTRLTCKNDLCEIKESAFIKKLFSCRKDI